MSDDLPDALKGRLPAPTEHAADVAKIATGVAAAFTALLSSPLAFAGAIAGAIAPIVIDRYVNRPTDILIDELKKGNLPDLSAAGIAPFVPMAYKFMEAAKEGEYERNLRILAAYLTGEMKQPLPDAAAFSRMARRVEGLSDTDLKVIALIGASESNIVTISSDEPPQSLRPIVSASQLKNSPGNKHGLTRAAIAESLADLAGRGFLIADGASRAGKVEETYRAAECLLQLLDRARDRMDG